MVLLGHLSCQAQNVQLHAGCAMRLNVQKVFVFRASKSVPKVFFQVYRFMEDGLILDCNSACCLGG